MKNFFSRNRREPSATHEPVLESQRLQEREENDRFLRQLYGDQGPRPGVNSPDPEPDPAPADAVQRGDLAPAGQIAAASPDDGAVPPVLQPGAESRHADDAEVSREGTRAALELLDVARQLLEGRDDVESRVARQLVARAIELIPAPGERRG